MEFSLFHEIQVNMLCVFAFSFNTIALAQHANYKILWFWMSIGFLFLNSRIYIVFESRLLNIAGSGSWALWRCNQQISLIVLLSFATLITIGAIVKLDQRALRMP